MVQGAPSDDLEAALIALKNESPGLAKAIQRAYEDDSETGAGGLAALQPDLLAEALIVEQIAGRRGAAIFDLALMRVPQAANSNRLWRALEVIARLGLRIDVGRFDGNRAQPFWIAQTVAGLGRAWPEHANYWCGLRTRWVMNSGNGFCHLGNR